MLKQRPQDPKYIADRKVEQEKMWRLFDEHWNKKEHKCEACGVEIWGENKSLYHDHMLPKSKYPEYKYDIENLYLCCWQCHSNKENGNPHPNHKESIEWIKAWYGIV